MLNSWVHSIYLDIPKSYDFAHTSRYFMGSLGQWWYISINAALTFFYRGTLAIIQCTIFSVKRMDKLQLLLQLKVDKNTMKRNKTHLLCLHRLRQAQENFVKLRRLHINETESRELEPAHSPRLVSAFITYKIKNLSREASTRQARLVKSNSLTLNRTCGFSDLPNTQSSSASQTHFNF